MPSSEECCRAALDRAAGATAISWRAAVQLASAGARAMRAAVQLARAARPGAVHSCDAANLYVMPRACERCHARPRGSSSNCEHRWALQHLGTVRRARLLPSGSDGLEVISISSCLACNPTLLALPASCHRPCAGSYLQPQRVSAGLLVVYMPLYS